jgi:predicted nucleic acid-binding protein
LTYLLDTNAISEPTKDRRNASALAWLEACPSNQSFLSAISIAEISYGIERLAPGRRADKLTRWRDRLIITLARVYWPPRRRCTA